MARPSRKRARDTKRLQEAGIAFLGLGFLCVVLPSMLHASPLGAGLRSLPKLGWLLMAVGGVLLWLLHPRATGKAQIETPTEVPAATPARRAAVPLPTAERIEPTMTETRAAVVQPPPRPAAWGPGVFAIIEWRRFEALVEALFAQAGFETKSQSHGADDGIDIWLYSKSHPDGEPVSLVQCKHWGKRVGVDKIRELRGVMAARNVKRGQFATTSTFTPDAVTFGRNNGINLLDVEGLLALIATRTPEQQRALLDVALEGEYWRPTCVNCGVKLQERQPRQGGNPFWGCVNYPKCRTTMQKRAAA